FNLFYWEITHEISQRGKVMPYFKKIVGERVYLSPINVEDVEKYTEWVNDLDVTINLIIAPNVYSLEKEREALIRLNKEGYNFAIVTLDKDELIGKIGRAHV